RSVRFDFLGDRGRRIKRKRQSQRCFGRARSAGRCRGCGGDPASGGGHAGIGRRGRKFEPRADPRESLRQGDGRRGRGAGQRFGLSACLVPCDHAAAEREDEPDQDVVPGGRREKVRVEFHVVRGTRIEKTFFTERFARPPSGAPAMAKIASVLPRGGTTPEASARATGYTVWPARTARLRRS